MPTIQDIPLEVFLDYILPAIPLPDLLSLAQTSRFFAILASDDTFWKLKLKEDLNYSITDARNSGFKTLYRGIRRPQVYVWGESTDGRLGLGNPANHFPDGQWGIPFPVELKIPHTRIIALSSGGWSFHALDDNGRVHAWGKLDSENFALRVDGFADPSQCAFSPITLDLPVPITSISSGRAHAMALDTDHRIWLFTSWGRPIHLNSPALDSDGHIVQIEAGWGLITALTSTGNVYIEWPLSGTMAEKIKAHDDALDGPQPAGNDGEAERENDARGEMDEDTRVVRCAWWELDHELLELPALPKDLPDLNPPPTEDGSEDEQAVKIVKIAAGDDFIVALTNRGHVLKMDVDSHTSTDELRDQFRKGMRGWIYLPKFSEAQSIASHPTFANGSATPVNSLHITHVSAAFQTFFAYSVGQASYVLMGKQDTAFTSEPDIIPALQNKKVVSVVLGDYHFGALTQEGTLLTWGQYSKGALGLGDPANIPVGAPGGYKTEKDKSTALSRRGWRGGSPASVEEPTEVTFDHQDGKKNKFVFGVAFSGWQSASLVIDLAPNEPPSSPVKAFSSHQERKVAEPDPEMSRWSGPPIVPNPGADYPRQRHTMGIIPPDDPTMIRPPRAHDQWQGGEGPLPLSMRHARIGFAGRGMWIGGRGRGRGMGMGIVNDGDRDAGAAGRGGREDGEGGSNHGGGPGRVLAGGFRGLPPFFGRGRGGRGANEQPDR